MRMNRLRLALPLVLMVMSLQATASEEGAVTDTGFDAELAAELGADRYGMRQYVMAFLRVGPNQGGDPEQARATQAAHLAHIRQMANDGKLLLAGPFVDSGDVRGIFILAVDDMAEAEALTRADPAVRAGRLEMELKPWYGSAALMHPNMVHRRIARENP
mgnify:CR=1 FL=1